MNPRKEQRSGYTLPPPDSLDLLLPLPPSGSHVKPGPLRLGGPATAPQLKPRFPGLLSPRPMGYPSPRDLSARTCSSDAIGDVKVAPNSACGWGGRCDLETGSSAAAAADSSRRTLVNTAATSAPSDTGALHSSTPVVPPDGAPPSATSDGAHHRADAGFPASASTVDDPADSTPVAECEVGPLCPRSPAGSTRSAASGTAAQASSAAGVAAALPTPPTTPGNSYAGADEIFDVGQLCRRLSCCAAGENVVLAHQTLHPATESWPVVLHEYGPILPHCSPPSRGERSGRAHCDLRAARGIVTCITGAAATVRDAVLTIGGNACVLLDETCTDVRFQDVCFQGGAIVCRGRGCRLTLSRVDLQTCTIIALHGAQVFLHDVSATAADDGIGVFACGAGTSVVAEQVTLTDGMLGVSVQGGAKFSGALVSITAAVVSGLHACGTGSYIQVNKGHVYDLGGPQPDQGFGDGALISQGAVCNLEAVAFERAEVGIHVRSRSRAILKNCRVHGNGGSAAVVEDAGLEMFDCVMEASGSSGLHLQRGAEAEAHGCSFTRSSLNAVYIQEGSEAVLRWCTLELSGLWSGLEVEGQGSAVECHSCLFLRNSHCGVFVHSRATAELSACESEGNGMSGYRVHGTDSRLKLDGCCARDVVAYQRHHNGVLACMACSPGGQMMSLAGLQPTGGAGTGGSAWTGGASTSTGAASAAASSRPGGEVTLARKSKSRGLLRSLVRALDPKRH